MELFGIIFYVIIIAIFINAKRMAQSGEQQNKSRNRNIQPGKYSGQRTPSVNIPHVLKKGYEVKPNVSKSGKTAVPNVPVKKRIENTFMEPHEEERIQPKIRNHDLWGEDEYANQRIAALRLMEGDPVPEGYVKIKCPYCAAENLVTKHCKQYHSCYFCRVPID